MGAPSRSATILDGDYLIAYYLTLPYNNEVGPPCPSVTQPNDSSVPGQTIDVQLPRCLFAEPESSTHAPWIANPIVRCS